MCHEAVVNIGADGPISGESEGPGTSDEPARNMPSPKELDVLLERSDGTDDDRIAEFQL